MDLDDVWAWGEVLKRVYAVGAVLVERRHLAEAAALIEQPITWDAYWEPLLGRATP